MTNYDEVMVRTALAWVAHIENVSAKAREIGTTEQTVRRWITDIRDTGTVSGLRRPTREPLMKFLGLTELAPREQRAKLDEFAAELATSSRATEHPGADASVESSTQAVAERREGREGESGPGGSGEAGAGGRG